MISACYKAKLSKGHKDNAAARTEEWKSRLFSSNRALAVPDWHACRKYAQSDLNRSCHHEPTFAPKLIADMTCHMTIVNIPPLSWKIGILSIKEWRTLSFRVCWTGEFNMKNREEQLFLVVSSEPIHVVNICSSP